MKTSSVRGMAIIIELKVVKDFEEMEGGCLQALEQIEVQQYEAALYKEGYRKILKYGICFYRKECMVRQGIKKIKVPKENDCDSKKVDVNQWIMQKTKGNGTDIFFECIGKKEIVQLCK